MTTPWKSDRHYWIDVEQSGGPDACWPWTRGRLAKGYGTTVMSSVPGGGAGGKWVTHRLAWTLVHGPIPDGMKVLHTCDNPPCCNPAHLFLGTEAHNTADMMTKGRNHWLNRTHCKYGHSFAEHSQMVTRANGKRYRRCMACRLERKQ